MEFRTRFTERRKVAYKTKGASRTKQSMKDECDVNNILKRYQKTGLLPVATGPGGDYIDVSAVGEYQESLNTVIRAQEAFAALPSGVRARFSNDPAQFLSFVGDPKNADELVKLGLAEKKKPIDPPIENGGPKESAKA